MAGALPSGSDPSEYSLGDYGTVGAGLSALAGRTQDNIEAALKAQMKNGGWKDASGVLFQNLDPSLPYTVALLKSIAEALLGSIIGADTIDQIFDVMGAWASGLQQAWEDFWSAFGIDINVVQNDLNTIFAVLSDVSNPEAWSAAWVALLDILTQFGLTADSVQHPFDLTKLVTDLTKDFMRPLGLILGADSPLNAANLFGQFVAPLAWLINRPPEMLWNPGFSGTISLSPGEGWDWDSAVYRTVSTDAESGSARATCSGAEMGLRSNTFTVVEGQGLDISVETMWSGLSATGKPIRVTLEGDGPGGPVSFLVGEAGPADGLDPLGWTGAPVGAKSVTMSNTWLVPAGVDTVYLRLGVTTAAAAGTVWFDAASVLMEASGIPTEWLSELTDAFAQVFAPFHDINSLFDQAKWSAAWEGVLTILGLAQSQNSIIANPNSLWTKLFQSTIPTGALNLHPDMDAVNSELAVIFNPFDNSNVDRAQAWDDLMGLFGLESHTADSAQWWDDLFDQNKTSLGTRSGATTAKNWVAAVIHDLEVLFDLFHWKYTAQEWTDAFNDLMSIVSGSWTGSVVDPATVNEANAAAGGSTSTSQSNNDLVTGMDSTIPHAPTFGFLQGAYGLTSTAANSVPYPAFGQLPIFLYYVVTAVKGGKESVASPEKYALILGPATVTINWTASTTSGVTYNVYRGTEPGKENRRVASGLTGTSFTDSASSANVATTPQTTAATAGGAVKAAQMDANTANTGVQGVADGIHQAINGDAATGTSKTAAAVKANLTAIPPKNITAQDYGVLGFGASQFSIAANANTFISASNITQAQASGASIGASASQGIWLAEPGIYSFQTIATFTASAGFSFNGALTPTLVYGDTAPPISGSWSGSHTLPCGTSATAVDQAVTYCIVGTNTYVRTDPGNRYFLPGVLWSNSSNTAATVNLKALAMIVVKLSN